MYQLSFIPWVLFFALASPTSATRQGAGHVTRAIAKETPGLSNVNATFDYVIVGGGTAGLTIASRLAEDPSLSVAVIEAGGYYEADNGNLSVVPGYCTTYTGTNPHLTNPEVDWGFVTTPQAGANNRSLHYARGRTLGGSSATNYMYYHRQTTGSAQKWASETEDETYTFPSLLPYYEKSDMSVFVSNGGPLQVSSGRYDDPFATWALPALQEIGQTAIPGLQSGNLLGSSYLPSTIDPVDSTRSSSESSFLQEALKATTIKVYNNTLAHRILFTKNTATGVSVSERSTAGVESSSYVLSARREVIVSAGAFQSPQLLMISGIGPRKTLEGLNLTVLKDLPGVGQNLWDQVWFGSSFRVNLLTGSAGLNNPALALAAVQEYVQDASGPLSISGDDVLGFEKLPAHIRSGLSVSTQKALNDTFPSDWPDLEFLPASGLIGNQSDYASVDPRDGYNYATVATALVAPLSRGNITINSTSMLDAPLINPNWLNHPADKEVAVAAFKRQRQVWDVLGNITLGPEYFPGPSTQSDADILKFIGDSLAPIWHAAATCKMGKANDKMAVVDTSTKVYGVQHLRVVDASSFPFLPPGHPQATVYALAEKIASEILQQLSSTNTTSKM